MCHLLKGKIAHDPKTFNPRRLVSQDLTRFFATSEKIVTLNGVFANATPAITALLQAFEAPFIWGEARVEREGENFLLKHRADEKTDSKELKPAKVEELRALASRNQQGNFRPLRSAPDLARGWQCQVQGNAALERALNEIYPGSVADWFAAQLSPVPVTNYREFTARQSGMYRITQMLSDEQAAEVIRTACHERFCLKRRHWSIEGLPPEPAEKKSLIPCLEPCAVLLETARKAMRTAQGKEIAKE